MRANVCLKHSLNSETVEVNFCFQMGHRTDTPNPGLSLEFRDGWYVWANLTQKTLMYGLNSDGWERVKMLSKRFFPFLSYMGQFVTIHGLCAADILNTANIEYIELSCYHTLYAKHLKDTNIACIEDLRLLNCIYACLFPIQLWPQCL